MTSNSYFKQQNMKSTRKTFSFPKISFGKEIKQSHYAILSECFLLLCGYKPCLKNMTYLRLMQILSVFEGNFFCFHDGKQLVYPCLHHQRHEILFCAIVSAIWCVSRQ